MSTILITGGTGLVGTALAKALNEKGNTVIILSRRLITSANPLIKYAQWDVDKGTIDKDAVQQTDYIVHLAGANVAEKRWTAGRKKEIVDSRVKSGELIVNALKEIPNKVKAVISASAIGWYGADAQIPNSIPFLETDPPAPDFLGTTCQKWEGAIQPVRELDKRLVILRTGIVLSNDGGAFTEFKKPLKFRVATILGNGKQIISWIHIDDLVQMYLYAMENENINGIYNAVAPAPVSNKTLIQAIGAASGKLYFCVHVPTFALKLALGEMSIEVLKSTTVSAKKIEASGYPFLFPTITEAVDNLML